ncbi:MAG: hypothetical protein PHF86_10530 [Candidatus Nanoarchaeia archaeon]|nr:hypothetical protein [Candidatus Nanoarchaeia archaeon]
MIKSLKLKIFSLNLLFTITLMILFVLIKEQVVNYITFLRDTYPKLLELQTNLSNNVTSYLPDLQSSLNLMTKTATKFLIIQYLVIPLTLFIIWIIFQGVIFYLLSNQKYIKKYLIKFVLTTLPFYLVILLLVRFIFTITPLVFFIALILLMYPLILLYLDKLKEWFNYKLILLYLLLLLLVFFFFVFSILTIISLLSQLNFILPLIVLILIILLISLLEIYFAKKVLK